VRILALDTATRATAVALLDTEHHEAIERRDDPPPGARPRHTTQLLGLVVALLGEAGVGWPQLDLIAVGTGPGTFTGLRIGITTARALSQARDIPIVGVSTLHAIAAAAASTADADGRDVLAVIDARRREVFAAGYTAAAAQRASAEADPPARPLAPVALASELAQGGRRWLAVGDGAVDSRVALEGAGALVPGGGSELHRVSAIAHCRLARGLPPRTADDIHPEYLRVPDAELTIRSRPPERRAP
jgi:tRNA threonylcarbamoyladenosine biosynthesis protein TsaB